MFLSYKLWFGTRSEENGNLEDRDFGWINEIYIGTGNKVITGLGQI